MEKYIKPNHLLRSRAAVSRSNMKLSCLAMAVFGAISGQVFAEEAQAPEEAKEQKASAFEVIEVTAQKRVQRMQDVAPAFSSTTNLSMPSSSMKTLFEPQCQRH